VGSNPTPATINPDPTMPDETIALKRANAELRLQLDAARLERDRAVSDLAQAQADRSNHQAEIARLRAQLAGRDG
jgi:hypothetical protein